MSKKSNTFSVRIPSVEKEKTFSIQTPAVEKTELSLEELAGISESTNRSTRLTFDDIPEFDGAIAKVNFQIPTEIPPALPKQLKKEAPAFLNDVDKGIAIKNLIECLRKNSLLIITEHQKQLLLEYLNISNSQITNEEIIKAAKAMIMKKINIIPNSNQSVDEMFSSAKQFDDLFTTQNTNSIFETMKVEDIKNTFEIQNYYPTSNTSFDFSIMTPSDRQTWIVNHFYIKQSMQNKLMEFLEIDDTQLHSIEDIKYYADRVKTELNKSFVGRQRAMSGLITMTALMSGKKRELLAQKKFTTIDALKFILMTPDQRNLWIQINTAK